ncbi:UDP-3-O-[3-hydroxymyristoyl] N-acetylglucosamine deacetylase [bacterium]|nr:UDP-3-O-[3-hydroxymyristoyl] N-acetylglucosamine deacetylase [bacterium]
MSGLYQTTLAHPLSLSGRGVHSGQACTVRLVPVEADYGVRFARVDLPGSPEIPALLSSVTEGPLFRQTLLRSPDDPSVTVATIEHILAVLHGMGVDNARVEMNAAEAPIWDGSAGELTRMISETGLEVHSGVSRRSVSIEDVVAFRPADARNVEYTAWPSEFLTLTYFLEYDHPAIGSQAVTFRVEPQTFAAEIACARTFCTEEEIEFLLTKGLIRGGEFDNAIVVGEAGVLNTELRWADEMARHKVLDLMGDLFLLGGPVRGHICSYRGGHHTNAQFMRYLRKEHLKA